MGFATTAAVLRDPRTEFNIEPVELDDLRAGEVLVRIQACGVCHTDSYAMSALPVPSVLGHEGAGVIEQVGAGVRGFTPGDTVIVSYPSCGNCANCQTQRPFICEQIIDLKFKGCRNDGSQPVRVGGGPITSAFFQQSSFARHAIALANNLIKVEPRWSPQILASLPCGVLTGVGTVVNIVKSQARRTLAVMGVGAVGMSAVMAARLVGLTDVAAIDVNPDRLSLAQDLGAKHTFNARDPDVERQIKTVYPTGLDYILDTSGNAVAIQSAINCIAMGGELGLVTVPEPYPAAEAHLNQFFLRAGSLRCVIVGAADARIILPWLLERHARGIFPVERLIQTYPFADINRAFADAKAGVAIKPVLLMS